MNDRLYDRAAAVDARIKQFGAALAQHLGCEDPSHPVDATSQEPVLVVGRIVCDSEGALNPASVMLEGCEDYSRGARVQLDLSRLPHYRIFPGQVGGVAVTLVQHLTHCIYVLLDLIVVVVATEALSWVAGG